MPRFSLLVVLCGCLAIPLPALAQMEVQVVPAVRSGEAPPPNKQEEAVQCPSPAHVFVEGHWVWRDSSYKWLPGQWTIPPGSSCTWTVWFGTASLGACRYDGSSFVWVGHGENANFGVRSIVEEKDGRFWLSNCVSRFAEEPPSQEPPSPAAGEPARYRKEPGIATDADPYSTFMSTTRDKDGVLWMATLGAGVFRYDGTKWTHFPVKDDDKPIWVYSIYQDRQGVLWLGTQEHGVYKFNGTAFEKFKL